jgi:hypothetical protein
VVAGYHVSREVVSFVVVVVICLFPSISLKRKKINAESCRTSSGSVKVVLDPPRFVDVGPLANACHLGHQTLIPLRETTTHLGEFAASSIL